MGAAGYQIACRGRGMRVGADRVGLLFRAWLHCLHPRPVRCGVSGLGLAPVAGSARLGFGPGSRGGHLTSQSW